MAARGRKDVDEALLLAFAGGAGPPAAASRAGCGEKTARRRLADPAFRARVSAARAQMVSDAVGRLSAVGVLAGDTLRALLGEENPQIRLGAARAALEYMLRGREQVELAEQVQRLQAQVEALRDGDRNAPGAGPPAAETGGGLDAAGADATPGAPAPGPGEDHERGGPSPGRLAGGPATVPISENASPLFEAGR
jgi:hypothetical protein